ncbi:glycosyltransferase [Lichenihabitans psoromatis]|uniref:glycosyltransferase n=1 Tax=Lichenihabitans psoromatis TaxID=2528642 RepID=UPI001036B42A|nr:glycosyltransferase [Lichenihabitans psoromatis]
MKISLGLPQMANVGRLASPSLLVMFYMRRAAARQGRSNWAGAEQAWQAALREASRGGLDANTRAQCWLQLGICQHFLDELDAAKRSSNEVLNLSAAVAETSDGRLLRARTMRVRRPEAARAILVEALAKDPNHTPILYEVSSISLDLADPGQARHYAEHLVALEPSNLSFTRLAGELAQRSGDWAAARRLFERLVELAPEQPDTYIALIGVLGVTGDLRAARTVVVQALKAMPGEYLPLQKLMEVYEAVGRVGRARLICRFLRRCWPHSLWHKLKYAEMLALEGNLEVADRELAGCDASIADPDYARSLWRVAKLTFARHEALARLREVCASHPNVFETELDYGYAIADVEGAAQASEHFHRLAIRHRFNQLAMHAIAHMAVREKVAGQTLVAWRRATAIHPADPHAMKEYCRALFEAGHGRRAFETCARHLARFEYDVAYVEFYTWLSVAVGRLRETLAFCRQNIRRYARSWQFLESGLICAIYLQEVDGALADMLPFAPPVANTKDVVRLYGLMRLAAIVEKEAALVGRFVISYEDRHEHPWLMRLAAEGVSADTSSAQTARLSEGLYAGSPFAESVESTAANSFARLTAPEIDRLFDDRSGAFPTIHIFSRFEQARGGSELHALDLAERLRQYALVDLWAPEMCHDSFLSDGSVHVVDPYAGQLPSPGGVIVLVGLYFDLGPWIATVRPSRIIALYNTFEAPHSMERVRNIERWTGRRVQLLYCSEMMKNELGLPGLFEPSPTDLGLFHPGALKSQPFTLGRHSRDVIEKHHPEDESVYRAVGEMGGRSLVIGGVSMCESFGAVLGLELRPATSKGIPEFLRSLDCFFYRTGTWVEPWGRVVIEAMASGLPVVAHRRGGYAEAIDQGVNGFLFNETEEAIAQITQLQADPDLRLWIGREARASAERIVGQDAMRRLAAFYFFDPLSLAETKYASAGGRLQL